MRSDYLAGASVVVREDGQDLREYEAETIQGAYKTTTAYIESVPGAEFTVEVVFDNTYPYRDNDLTAYISLDGVEMIGKICPKNKFSQRTITFDGAISGTADKPTIRKFAFAALTTSTYPQYRYVSPVADQILADGQPKPSMKEKFAKLGDIEVRLYRCRLGALGAFDYSACKKDSPVAGGVPEKSLKGRSVSSHAT